MYVVLYNKPVPILQTESNFSSNLFYFGFIFSKLKQYYSRSSKQTIVHKIPSVSPETEKKTDFIFSESCTNTGFLIGIVSELGIRNSVRICNSIAKCIIPFQKASAERAERCVMPAREYK